MKGPRTGLLAGFVSMSLLRLVSAVLSFALVVYLARQMGPAALGAYALVTSVFVLLQFVPLMGLHVALTRDAAGMPERTGQQLVNGLALALPVSVIVLLGAGLAGTFMTWEQAETPRWIWTIALAFVPTAVTTVVEAVLVGRERTGVVAAVGLLENVGRTLASLVALYAGFGLDALFVLFSAGRLLAAVAYLGMADVRNLLDRRHLDVGALRELCRQIPTFFTIMLLAQLMERLGFLLLAPLAGVKALGVYAACYKLYELSLMVPRILSMLLLPRFAACLATRPRQFDATFQSMLKAGLAAGTPLALLGAWFGDDIMRLYGRGYEGGALPFQLLCVCILGVALNNLLSVVLVVTRNQRRDLVALSVAVIAYTALLVLLVPRWGALGAATATTVVAFLQPGVAALLLSDRIDVGRTAVTLLRTAVAGGAMWATLMVPLAIPVVLQVGLALVVYAACTALIRAWSTADALVLRAGLGSHGAREA